MTDLLHVGTKFVALTIVYAHRIWVRDYSRHTFTDVISTLNHQNKYCGRILILLLLLLLLQCEYPFTFANIFCHGFHGYCYFGRVYSTQVELHPTAYYFDLYAFWFVYARKT